MAYLIDKDTLVAEIERRIKEIDEIGTYLSPKGVLTNLLCHLDTLEVKEADLEQISKNYALNNTPWDDCMVEIQDAFKSGFELGLKSQKGEE